MRLRLETSPAELAAKGEALLKALSGALEPVAPELAEQLQKALPPREHSLKYPALQELHSRMAAEYERTLGRMMADIGRVLESRGKRQEPARGSRLQKAGPYIGPRGGKWADPQHTIPWEDAPSRRTPRTGMINVSDETVRSVAEKLLANAAVNQHGIVRGLKGNATEFEIPTPDGGKMEITARLIVDPDVKDLRGVAGSARVRAYTEDGRPYVDGADVTLRVKPVDGADRDTLAQTLRNVLSHELTHAVDPTISRRLLARAKTLQQNAQQDRRIAEKEGISHTDYLNLKTEVTARLQQVGRDLIDKNAAKTYLDSVEAYESDPENMPPPYTPTEMLDWSPTWQAVEEKLTPENRKRFLRMAARIAGALRAGELSPIEKGMDDPPGLADLCLPGEFQKAEPPQADGFEDHSAPIAEKDGRAYARIKVYLQRKGYKVSDFEPGGPLYGWSLNELLDLAHGKRD